MQALVEETGLPRVENCSLDVRSKRRSCVRGKSYGCLAGGSPGVWVRGGCRGQFVVDGIRVACGHPDISEQEQSCHAVIFRNTGSTEVWAAGSVRALDNSNDILQAQPWQALARSGHASILVGVINGHAERRAPFRCEFAHLRPSRGRLRFVVGSDAPARDEETDLLIVPDVPQQLKAPSRGSQLSSPLRHSPTRGAPALFTPEACRRAARLPTRS